MPKQTNYTFSMDNDDGALMYIDGKLIISHNGAHDMKSSNCYLVGPVLGL